MQTVVDRGILDVQRAAALFVNEEARAGDDERVEALGAGDAGTRVHALQQPAVKRFDRPAHLVQDRRRPAAQLVEHDAEHGRVIAFRSFQPLPHPFVVGRHQGAASVASGDQAPVFRQPDGAFSGVRVVVHRLQHMVCQLASVLRGRHDTERTRTLSETPPLLPFQLARHVLVKSVFTTP